MLIVENFLGLLSPPVYATVLRSQAAIPIILIDAPPVLVLKSMSTVVLTATATVASCHHSSSPIAAVVFSWTHVNTSRTLDSPIHLETPGLVLDDASRRKSALTLRGAELMVGVAYTLRVTGCMRNTTGLCGYAEIEVAIEDEPLVVFIAGGHRTVGSESGLTLDACGSHDPDDAAARCDESGDCGTLTFMWRCFECDGVGDDSDCSLPCQNQPPPVGGNCSWTIAPGKLTTLLNYSFVAYVMPNVAANEIAGYELLQPNGDVQLPPGSRSADAFVRVVDGNLPVVSIVPPFGSGLTLELKQDPDSKLPLEAVAFVAGVDNATFTYAWTVVAEAEPEASPDLSVVSTTGQNEKLLVIEAGTLVAGGRYTFEVTATCCGSISSTAIIMISMTRPPWGGSLTLSPGPYQAMSELTLTAKGWKYVDPDPLQYLFSCRQIVTGPSASVPAAKQLTTGSLGMDARVEMPEGNWSMIVNVVDRHGTVGSSVVNITVGRAALDAASLHIQMAAMAAEGKPQRSARERRSNRT